MKCQLISIGDELLIGQVVNTNAARIGQMMTGIGVEIDSVLSIGDSHEKIRDAITDALGKYPIVITTGGLGPTKDDITVRAIADAIGSEIVFYQEAYDHLEAILAQFGKTPTESHRQQCFLPDGVRMMTNKVGTAPGMHFERNGSHLYVLPGVPHEMIYLMEHEVLPSIRDSVPGLQETTYRTIATVGEGESRLAERLTDIEDNLPDYIRIAYLPAPGRVRVRVLLTQNGPERSKHFDEVCAAIRERLDKFVYAVEDISLQDVIGRLLLERSATLSLAESCTGGYTSHLITSIPGSSRYFVGGGVTYSNELKENILGVRHETLAVHGAVSEQTAEEMAIGACKAFGSDLAVSITGIAGPDGGSDEKPVGTVWIAVSNGSDTKSKQFRFTRNREINIQLSAIAALNMLRKFLSRSQ